MGYWGWRRWLAVFVSVWIVGCSPAHDRAETVPPTMSPQITLTLRAPASATPQAAAVLPTAAPTAVASPTPLLYSLQRGDTLLGVARQFGVPLATLEAANPAADPLGLQIGQTIMIPYPRFDEQGRPMLPTATPLPLRLDRLACGGTATSGVVCLGRVHNPLPRAVGQVAVRVRLWDAAGGTLAENMAAVEQAAVAPGGSAPYRVLLAADPRAVAGADAALISADWSPDGRYLALHTISQRGETRGSQYRVNALLRNPLDEPVQVRRAVVTLLDASGAVIGYRVLPLDQPLAPGGELPLTLAASQPDSGAPSDFSLYVEAERRG